LIQITVTGMSDINCNLNINHIAIWCDFIVYKC